MAYRSYVIVATICLFLLTSDIETMIIYVIINLFSETDVQAVDRLRRCFCRYK